MYLPSLLHPRGWLSPAACSHPSHPPRGEGEAHKAVGFPRSCHTGAEHCPEDSVRAEGWRAGPAGTSCTGNQGKAPVCPEITHLPSKHRFNQLARFLSILSEQLCTLFWGSLAEISLWTETLRETELGEWEFRLGKYQPSHHATLQIPAHTQQAFPSVGASAQCFQGWL